MTSKKGSKGSSDGGPTALKIGSRVRCSDDGVEGRIVWANAVSVKIRWNDSEEVTWRRDSLAGRPIEFLDGLDDGDKPEAPGEPAPDHRINIKPKHPAAEPKKAKADSGTSGEPAPVSVKPKRQRKAPSGSQEKKLSALDAAAKVLDETAQPMTCQEMIELMGAKGYWKSPEGRTPAATLYSAMLREIASKGKEARFVKTERGKFARNGAA